MKKQRLQKMIASTGFCSRRKAEDLIKNNKVRCNGKIAKLGDVAGYSDFITIGGVVLKLRQQEKIYLMLNKPKGYVTTLKDEKGRKTVIDLLKGAVTKRVYPVGRLDLNSQGLLLLTNDGEFANAVMHPSSKIKKIYEVTIKKQISKEEVVILEQGVVLDGFKTAPCKVEILLNKNNKTILLMTIHEGRNRQIRRMILDVMGCYVKKLKRIQIGGLKLNNLPVGRFKKLSLKEAKIVFN